MRSIRTFITALRALRRNMTRAILTTLGIVIGVGAVIAMMEIGAGASAAIERSVQNMGANSLTIFPGAATTSGVRYGSGTAITLKPDDADAMLNECTSVKAAAPVVNARTQIVYGNKNWVPQSIVGTTPAFLEVRNWQVDDGEAFSDRDVRNGAAVCLLGKTTVTEVFGTRQPIGETIRINNVLFRVIGVLKPKGANIIGMDQDDIVIAPWTTIQSRVSGSALGRVTQSVSSGATSSVNSLNDFYPSSGTQLYPAQSDTQAANNPMQIRFIRVDQIIISAWSQQQLQPAMKEISALLRERHRLLDGQPDDFTIRDMTEITNMLKSTTEGMTKLLLSVALISLVVGGVGIMNIMLVSVTERTREIGLRMAVGGRGSDILRQFLTEAVVLSLLGGAMGILLGRGTSALVATLLKWPVESSPGAVVAAVAVSATVGIVFGFYPAWKAARLDPIEALRYE